MNMCGTLRISLPLWALVVLPGLARAQFVDQAVSALHEQAERKVDEALERGAARLEGELGKVAGKVTGHIGRKVGESLSDVQEEVAEIKARVETVKAALDTANGVISVAGRTVDFICAGTDCSGGGCTAYVNTILANSRGYVQASRQTVGSVNVGLDDLLSKLEAAKTQIGQCQAKVADAVNSEQAGDLAALANGTDEEKEGHAEEKADDDGLTEADREKMRKENEEKEKKLQAELQDEQEEADAARARGEEWTRTGEDGKTTTKTRLEEQREKKAKLQAELQKEQEEADAARARGETWTRTRADGTTTTMTRLEEEGEDVDSSDERFDDGETHP